MVGALVIFVVIVGFIIGFSNAKVTSAKLLPVLAIVSVPFLAALVFVVLYFKDLRRPQTNH